MMKKFMVLAAIAGSVLIATSSPFTPGDAATIHPSESLSTAAAETEAVDLIARLRWRRTRQAAGVGLFIVPGLYWGPAWWDPAYTRACWKQISPCKGCASNWIYVC